MNTFNAILLGLIQGVTEFLPVSSSGHLRLAQSFMEGFKDIPPLFDIVLHVPSLLAVIIFFRKKIARLFVILFRWILKKEPVESYEAAGAFGKESGDTLTGSEERGRKTIVAVFVTTFVTGVIGAGTSRLLPDLPLKAVFAGFIFTGLLLIFSALWTRRAQKNCGPAQAAGTAAPAAPDAGKKDGLSLLQAAVIGLAQGIGTLPGVSRSGSTISGALFCGVDRGAAGEYSFIVSIPAILGAFVLEAKDGIQMTEAVGAVPLFAACAASFLAAYASLAFLMHLVRRGRLEWFSVYLIPLGILGLLFI